jgi:hypothetical protein
VVVSCQIRPKCGSFALFTLIGTTSSHSLVPLSSDEIDSFLRCLFFYGGYVLSYIPVPSQKLLGLT